MEQKFVSFEDAIEKLGISADRLNELREHGQLRAYRDGSSWKFRADEIEGMVTGGIPEPPPPSDIGLVDQDELIEASPLEVAEDEPELRLASEDDAEESGMELELADESAEESGLELELEPEEAEAGGSELDLAALDDTVTAGMSDVVLDTSDEPGGSSDSILLSEEELGDSARAQGSTVIGKDEIEADDADLKLAGDDDVTSSTAAGASDVLSSGIAGPDVLDQLQESSGGLSAFEDIEELELDLAAESSRILSPEDLAAAKGEPKAELTNDSDLRLDVDALAVADDGGEEADMGSTDVPLEELEAEGAPSDEGSGSEIDLAGDDIVVADAGGSDITLDSGDSGINLLPSDSGLALDDIPLDVGGSAILSSLSLEGSDPEISLIGEDAPAKEESGVDIQTDDDFQLTPLSEGTAEAEGDSSSQVIALDAGIEDLSEEAASVLDADVFAEEEAEGVVLSDDFAEQPAAELGMDYAPAGVAPAAAEQPYTALNILGLGSCVFLLLLCTVMMVDMVRNMWSWDQPFALNSSLMDAILSWL